MKKYREALDILFQHTYSFGVESCSLDKVHGKVLAEDILADRDYPPFNRAAMDGYAVEKWGSGEGGSGFKVREVLYAGTVPSGSLQKGEVYKIMTGAAVPEDADLVIRVEDSYLNKDGTVSFEKSRYEPFQHIARKGEDVRKGEVLVQKNTFCDAGVVALLAAVGQLTVIVKRNPTVAVITSGNEVKPVDYPVNDVQIRNSNRFQLIASLEKMGIEQILTYHSNDTIEELKDTFLKVWDADIIISCGAVSMGDADHIPKVLSMLGAECLFHKVAIKPGKPIWCGLRPGNKIIFALPGNPFSTRVNTRLFIHPFIRSCMEQNDIIPQFEFEGVRSKKNNLDELFPATLTNNGKIKAIPFNGSGDIRAGVHAMGIAMHPSEKMIIENGERLQFFFF